MLGGVAASFCAPSKGGMAMPVIYKIDILAALKEKGYSTYRLRKDKLLAEATIQAIRNGSLVSWATIAQLCDLLECQPGDLLEYVKDADVQEKGNSVS